MIQKLTKILVTGATGFIGSNLVPKLIKENHEVYCLIRYVSNRTPNLPDGAEPVFCDLRDALALKKLIKEINPEMVIHLAAASSVASSHLHIQDVMDTNLTGTINLGLACLELNNLEKFIMAGTSEEYGNQDAAYPLVTPFPIKETAQLYPNQPYSISKVAADHFLNYLYLAHGFPTIIARPFNTYGRTDNFTFVTERIITQMLKNQGVTLGNSTPVRDFLYVDDHVNGYLSIIKHPKILDKIGSNRAVNFATGEGFTIGDWTKKIADKIGYDYSNVKWKFSYARPTEIFKLIGDNTKARELLGWEPKTNWSRGLDLTIKKIEEHGY
jgi:nucleoside-diphosphate-sugar epimerase